MGFAMSLIQNLRVYRTQILIACTVLGLAVWLGLNLWLGPKTPVAMVVQRDFVQTVVASGHIESPHRVDLGVQITGTVKAVPVNEGQTVTAAQPLIQLEDAELVANARQAESAVAQAQAKLRQLREVQAPLAEQTMRQAQVNQDTAARALQRTQELFSKGFIGQAALDEATRAEQVMRSQLKITQQQLSSTRAGGSDMAVAETALSQAQAGAELARARLRYSQVLAPAAGTLIARNVEPGDAVQAGKVLMVLSPEGETQVVVQIDEKHLNLLKVGQTASVSSDAYPDQRFTAELMYINPGVDAQRGSVEVKLRVPQPPAYVRQDMTVSVDIEVAKRSQAVLVPTEAVHNLDSPEPWVMKVVNGKAVRTSIRLGLRSQGMCEVLEGLVANDQVLATAALPVNDKARVRPVSNLVAK
ncbi:efflux transporter periplasmic adaptor subunit [Limnohabitans sp. Rim8]|uniref:Efflux transporter periplasmic adaptor subunit n=2 Tax=Comamonadaceae TaxID=80864 RepID=A0A315EVU0_9BURK|nr:efflux transporter periplasmic adaptor subunit [Limnohabitans sp. Rim8]PUE60064.1 efflux transporter periplasmic adaptor subunit [Limnohabitans curvus]